MSESAVDQVLISATTEVLETMFFTPVLGSTAAAASSSGLVAAQLAFCGALEGTFAIQVTLPAAREIAANFLGSETGEPSPDAIGEVLTELANMICGSVLSHLDGEAHFDLSHPQMIDPMAVAGLEAASRTLEIEGGEVSLFLHLNKKS
ncbi:MAG TPA: chemotaxis protein CheX [Bryobacteraceae bacterium]|nr:chemotaxis protein CheX [Bryobacteraceae bacterium]